jgi:hypothetical protein
MSHNLFHPFKSSQQEDACIEQKLADSEDSPDPLWNLLAQDAKAFPLADRMKSSTWFATRTAALALQTPQKESFFTKFPSGFSAIRWWMPIPLAGVAALALLLSPHGTPQKDSPLLSEAEFEQHMELIVSNDSFQ